jgi:hypothetical protein
VAVQLAQDTRPRAAKAKAKSDGSGLKELEKSMRITASYAVEHSAVGDQDTVLDSVSSINKKLIMGSVLGETISSWAQSTPQPAPIKAIKQALRGGEEDFLAAMKTMQAEEQPPQSRAMLVNFIKGQTVSRQQGLAPVRAFILKRMQHAMGKLDSVHAVCDSLPNDKLVLDFTFGTLGNSDITDIFPDFDNVRDKSDNELSFDEFKRGLLKYSGMVNKTGWAIWQPVAEFNQLSTLIDDLHEEIDLAVNEFAGCADFTPCFTTVRSALARLWADWGKLTLKFCKGEAVLGRPFPSIIAAAHIRGTIMRPRFYDIITDMRQQLHDNMSALRRSVVGRGYGGGVFAPPHTSSGGGGASGGGAGGAAGGGGGGAAKPGKKRSPHADDGKEPEQESAPGVAQGMGFTPKGDTLAWANVFAWHSQYRPKQCWVDVKRHSKGGCDAKAGECSYNHCKGPQLQANFDTVIKECGKSVDSGWSPHGDLLKSTQIPKRARDLADNVSPAPSKAGAAPAVVTKKKRKAKAKRAGAVRVDVQTKDAGKPARKIKKVTFKK